jgi:hypothetical protein
MTPDRPRLPVALLLVGLLAACTPSASGSPSVAPSEEPSQAEPSVVPSESAAALCDPGVVCDGPLAAGDYVSETTGARVEFTLDEHDWSGLADTEGDGFGLFLADVGPHAISVVAFSGEIFANACDPNAGTLQLEATPAAFMNMLTTRPGITATTPIEVEVGGLPALQTDLTTTVAADCEATGGGRIWLWTLPVHGDFHFDAEETARVIAVYAEPVTVVLVNEAFPEVDYDHLLEHFTELVETMTITPL